ncbi:uncharacterized protein [Triticum aestivum]|uniref:uncharacterized protein n=1 Tax=Triticum aestivum TaxID=4565 RepID=UPI001D026741|nr:uncharacterized protein LOC123064645 [Triticum aestivum]
MELCEQCVCFLVTNDVLERTHSHLTGKQHIGYGPVRDFLFEYKAARERRGLQGRLFDLVGATKGYAPRSTIQPSIKVMLPVFCASSLASLYNTLDEPESEVCREQGVRLAAPALYASGRLFSLAQQGC